MGSFIDRYPGKVAGFDGRLVNSNKYSFIESWGTEMQRS